jgi:glyoxylase-like metal-dependent hydrolase (beta-lactamase superfamily II)
MLSESNLPDPWLTTTSPAGKLPRSILPGIFAFPPNRDTLGGTAYFIVTSWGNIIIDAPAWHDLHRQFVAERGGAKWTIVTHRGAIGKTNTIAKELGCEVIVQEREAYLLPELKVTTFGDRLDLNDSIQLIWTPGHSPGSACVYYNDAGGVLFTGRHLLPNHLGAAVPLRTSKTFHWQRQLQSAERLWEIFPDRLPLAHICPGSNTGLLRGKGSIEFRD